ncbi:hypothetical protein DFQ30_000732 [Apophysomyces sp. BC1015]|nr:hypothetical protein DFQ30_000732 [Apophysomyces sp. BC1015]
MLAALAACSTFDQQVPAPIVDGTAQPVPALDAASSEPAAPPVLPEPEPREARTDAERAAPKNPHRPPPRVTVAAQPPARPVPAPRVALRLLYPRQVKGLLDTEVQRPDGKMIGRAVDLVVDTNGAPREIVVNLTGFMGVGDRKVNFPADALRVRPVGPRVTDALELVPSRTPMIDPAKPAQVCSPSPGTAPLMDAMVQRTNGSKVGRIVDVLIDAALRPQVAVLELGNWISPDRRRIAADWSALRFVVRDKALQLLLDLSDAQLNASPLYAADQPIRAVSPAGTAVPAPAGAVPAGGSAASVMSDARSLRALDRLNFFLANVQTGFGPFIASYLATHKWTQGEIGIALSVGTITAMVSQVPAGALIDSMQNKRAAAMAAIVAIAICALLLAGSPTTIPVLAAEVFHGFASCMLTPALAAISLALVGRRTLGDRLGRNARFASIGGAVAAGLMGLFGEYVSVRSVFWLTAALTLPAIVTLYMIDPLHLGKPRPACRPSPEPPRPVPSVSLPRERIGELLRDRRLLTFAACIVLFHLSNAAMLNLAAGEVTAHMGDNVQLVIAACIIVPQIIVALLSPWVGRSAQRWGRRPILLLGFTALPVRALLFAGITTPSLLVPVQVFDGLSAAVFGVMLPLIAADVAGGKGRYNLCIGVFGLAAGIGATLSTMLAGLAADRFGNGVSFIGLAAAGALAVLLVWLAMPETRESDVDAAPAARDA